MRIALDARTVYRHVRRGTGRNLVDLYRTVAKLRPNWKFTLYHRAGDHLPPDVAHALDLPNIEPRHIDMRGDRIDAWGRWRLPFAAWRDRVDLLHCPANLCPSWMPVPTLVTVHDLIPLDMPEGRPLAELRAFEQSVARAAARAAGIITPSHYTRERLIQRFDADPYRITVNPWAPDRSMRYISNFEPVVARYGIDKPFVIHFGAPAPRKNTARVLESWAMMGRIPRSRYQLLIVGLDGDSLEDMKRRAMNMGIADSVRLHGFADSDDLPALLSASRVLCYPSLSEGFGLPILDAWATNTCVVTSNLTSIPEVAGSAAKQVDPAQPRAIADAMLRFMRDRCLRKLYVSRGRAQLPKYTWTATAERFISAVEKAIGQGAQRTRAA